MINFAPCASAKKVPYISLIHILLPGNCIFFSLLNLHSLIIPKPENSYVVAAA